MTVGGIHISWHSIFIFILFIVVVALINFIVQFLKRLEQRSIERLTFEKESLAFQKQQVNTINELNIRIFNIEKKLKDIE